MTKKVRVENADTSNFKVVVQTWDMGVDGAPDTMADEQVLSHPASMTREDTYLTSTRYLIVKEA